MNSDARLRSLLNRSAWASAWNWLPALVVGLFLAAGPAFAEGKTPAKPVPGTGPDARWDSSSPLQPAAILGDSTHFAGHSDPREGKVLEYHALDVEGGTLYSATGQGITVHDLKNGPPTGGASSYLYGWITGGHFPFWEHVGDSDWFVKYVDAPAGNKNLAALTMDVQGFSIINAADPDNARVAYQAKTVTNGVYAVNVGGTDWAYALGDQGKVVRFNMTAAANMTKCLDDPIGTCPGVHKGVVTSLGSESWVTLHGAGSFLATGKWLGGGPIKIWNLADPAAPSLALQINAPARGLAMWQSGGSYYLARVDGTGKKLTIHNLICSGGSCSGAPEVWSTTLTSPTILPYVTASQDGGKAYLYIGGDDFGSCVPQREYIFDVTSPGSPVELTPKKHPAGYWGWYYQDCATGFNLVGPRMAQVYNGHLYRAAMSILDAHKVGTAGPPVANFSWSPSEIYPGTPVQFTDQSSGGPDQWTWNFESGTPSVSSDQNPSVTFSDDGEWNVSLAVSSSTNGPGVPVPPKKVKVLDPAPKLGSVTVSPANPKVCQPVTMTAVGQGGQPALTFKWEVQNTSGTVFTQTNGNTSQVWNTATPPPAVAGSYTARLTISNGKGPDAVQTAPFTLTAPAPLPLNGQFSVTCTNCTNGSPPAGTATFSVDAPGATEWNWDFDGDNVFDEADWTNDPDKGPSPTHNYTSKGVRQVRVKVRNCLNPAGVISAPVEVDIKQITPLKALFAVSDTNCIGGTICTIDAGYTLQFPDASTGAALWHYDWNGDGTYEDANNTGPKTSHVYSTPGTNFPKVKVTRSNEEDVYPKPSDEPIKIIVGNAAPVAINISGPSSGKPDEVLSFSASATGCSPNANGWTWNAAGGTITGGNSGSVTIKWTGLGNKAISVTNSACGSVLGSKSVNISNGNDPGPGGGSLKADFSFSPALPAAGQAVAFNGAAATGATGWVWDFGDGSPFGTGTQVSHTYAQAGSYRVQLSVTGPGSCPPAPFCEASVQKTVVVGTGEPPLGASFNTSATCISEFGLNICTAEAGQAVTFTSTSTGNPTSVAWTFGDGGSGTGASVTHTFQTAGTYTVTLNVGKGTNTASASKTFNVTGAGEPPLGASFNTNASCSGNTCSAQVGQAVTFTNTSTGNPASVSWSFGDGGSGTGASVTHTYQTAGTFTVTLNIGKGANTASASKTFNVSGVVQPEASTIVLPWVAQSRGVLKQTSNLYVHNPGTTMMEIVLEFRRQGQPEANPPQSAQAIHPGATIYVGDVLKQLFNVENATGFVTLTKTKGDRDPVITSFNNVPGKKGAQYGQTIPGVRLGNEAAAAATVGSRVQSLVGLSDNSDRQAYFGITNPNAVPAVYRLKFFDSLGRPIGTPSGDLTLPSFGQRQYQLSEIRSQFGISAEDDYRVEVETVSGGNLYPYGTNVQTGSKDPSFQGVGKTRSRLYLIGAMRTKGLKKSEWQSDVVLANTGTEIALADVSFLNAGPSSQLTAPFTVTLQPGQTERLENIGHRWNVKDAVGLVVVESDAPDGVFPVVQGESYLSTKAKPGARYGLSMAAMTDEDAAGPGEVHYLVGLRHDANNRSTVWIVNPTLQEATYDLIYRGLDGKILGRLDNVIVGAAKMRQFSPSQHPFQVKGKGKKKNANVAGGFTLQIVVKSGKALAAAQVVNNKTNDPGYIQGETR